MSSLADVFGVEPDTVRGPRVKGSTEPVHRKPELPISTYEEALMPKTTTSALQISEPQSSNLLALSLTETRIQEERSVRRLRRSMPCKS